jgi:4-hydroxy-3-methylbut-2-enyl diphosphate reductase
VHTEKNLPIDKIKDCTRIGVASGASAPERLVQNLISEIREHCNVSLEEVIVAEEKVVFKLPKTVN